MQSFVPAIGRIDHPLHLCLLKPTFTRPMRFLIAPKLGCLLSLGLYAQTALLKGRVENQEGEPLPYALVRLPQSGFQVLTRGDGTFQLYLSEGPTPLEIRYLGFVPYRETLLVSSPNPIERTFRLRPQDIRLPSVIITEGNVNPADLLIRRADCPKAHQPHLPPSLPQ